MSGDNQKQICFPPFRLDCPEHRLYRGDALIPLRPKSFELLQYLALRPARLVTKEELLQAVWPDTATTDTVLKVCIREIREALGDDAAQSRYIETAHRRGYRFIANIEEPGRPQNVSRSTSPLTLVGREVEIERLNSLLAGTLSGARQVVFVTGEPGIGKTTLVQSWLDQITVNSNVLVAHGQCLEQYGSSEAYLPMLEAVSRLCRGPKYEAIIAVLRRHAPTWLAQIPWLITETERHVFQSETLGATRERMLREIAEAVETITEDSPLLLVLEDLHWSDYSTLDLISYLARRSESARLMLIGTYRPADISQRHPLNAVKQELRAHQQCEELPLKLLDENAVATHLAARFPDNRFPSDLPHSLHQRTEGNPMFINHLVDFFVDNGLIVAVDGPWVLTRPLSEVEATLPDNIRQIIEKQAAGLSEQEQQILESASIAGLEFSTAMVAASLNKDHFEVEEVCEKLARRHLFIRFADGVESAAGEISARYSFIHALYQNAFYERVPIARAAYLHKKIAERLEATLEDRSGSLAAELALHFEKARDYPRAVANLHDAAQHANHRSANREAETLSRRGLGLVTKLTHGPERLQLELLLQTCLATSLSATYGYGAAEVEQAYSRARELCDESSSDLQLAPVLWGLWRFYLIRSDLQAARELAQQLFDLARSEQNDALLIGPTLPSGQLTIISATSRRLKTISSKASRFTNRVRGTLIFVCMEVIRASRCEVLTRGRFGHSVTRTSLSASRAKLSHWLRSFVILKHSASPYSSLRGFTNSDVSLTTLLITRRRRSRSQKRMDSRSGPRSAPVFMAGPRQNKDASRKVLWRCGKRWRPITRLARRSRAHTFSDCLPKH